MASDSQSQKTTFPSTSGPRIASRLINACVMHVSQVSGMKRKKTKHLALFDDLGRFRLWVHGFDVLPSQSYDVLRDPRYRAQPHQTNGDPKPVHDQFDEVLERSEYLKEPTIILLASFASILLLTKFQMIGNDVTRRMVQAALNDAILSYPALENECSSGDSDQSWKSAIGELHDIVGSLFTLAEPLNDVLEELHTRTHPALPPIMECYKNIILDKFPNAGIDLVLRFAEGNTECHDRLRSQAAGMLRVKSEVEEISRDDARQHASQSGSRPPDIILCQSSHGSKVALTVNLPTLSEIESRLQPSFHDSGLGGSHPSAPSLVPPSFHDSGLGSSRPNMLSLALPASLAAPSVSTVFSMFTSPGNRPSLPQMPKDCGSKIGFSCPVCSHRQKAIFTNRQWRKHVFSDLRPYMCTYDSCPTSTHSYQSTRDWMAHQISHLVSADNNPSSCPFCTQQLASDDRRFYSHVGHHMEDIRLLSLPPSHRQSDDIDNDYQGLENSSDTERPGLLVHGEPGALSSVEEEPSPKTAPGLIQQYLRTHDKPDKEHFLGNWLTSTGVASDWNVFTTGGSIVSKDELTSISNEHSVALPVIEPIFSPSLTRSSGNGIDKTSQSPLAQALSRLNTEDREAIDFTEEEKPALFSCLIEDIQKRREFEVKEWNGHGRGIYLMYARDSLDALLKKLDRYVSISEIATRHETDVTAPVWGGFRALFMIATWDGENLEFLVEGMASLIGIVSRCVIYESLYLTSAYRSGRPLHGSMVDLYVSILECLASARRHLIRSSSRKFPLINQLYSRLNLKPLLDNVQRLEEAVTREAGIAHLEGLAKGLFDTSQDTAQLLALCDETQKQSTNILTSIDYGKRREILDWLSDVPFRDHHSSSSYFRHPNTCSWLLANETFVRWESSDSSSILWLSGPAGSGKTILASKIVDQAELASQNYAHAYFYCKYHDAQRSSAAPILRSLVRQFCHGFPGGNFPSQVLNIYKQREKEDNLNSLLTVEESEHLLIALCAEFQRTTILIDGLDECHESTKEILLDILELLERLAPKRIKILVTSRDDGFIRKRLERVPKISIEASSTAEDIKHYITSVIESYLAGGKLLGGYITPGLKKDIIEVLQKQSQGFFLWARFQIAAICRQGNEADVRAALRETPSEVVDVFSKMFSPIRWQNTHAGEILIWILHAYQPLTGYELCEALSVDPERSEFSASSLTVTGIIDICKGLVKFDYKMLEFRFLHVSVEQFLLPYFPPETAHTSLAKVCLTLLTYHHTVVCHDHLAPSLTLEYARANWTKHVQSSGIESNDLLGFCYRFFKQSTAFKSWYSHLPNDSIYPDPPDHLALIAPQLGLWNIFAYDVISGTDVNSCDSKGWTALHVASRNVDLDGLSWLLHQRDIDVNRKNYNGETALTWAAGGQSVDVVNRLLYSEGIDIHNMDNNGRTAMDWAIKQGNDNVVEVLKVALSESQFS